ncbi:MAG: tail fiber domain-containing protein [Desulfobacteraceae bacterium]|nr:MAG: tail fiber domain-containing protein [Desulfobacteraceae bacterium]
MKSWMSSLAAIFVVIFTSTIEAGADELVVTENGNVGIGTIEPVGKLQVNGKIRLGAGWLNWDEENAELGIYFQSKGANYENPNILHPAGRIYGANFEPGWNGQALVLEAGKSWENDTIPWVNNQIVLRGNGNIGIGKQSPECRLDVLGCTRIINPDGRTLMIERDDDDAWITFHDPWNYWYSMGIDRSDGGKFKLNYGGFVGETNQLTLDLSGNLGIGINNPQDKLDVDGYVRAMGARLTSDLRWKKNIATITNALDLVSQLRGVQYEWTNKSYGESRQLGVVAQEVEEIFPEVVHTDSQGYKSVEYAKLIAPIIEAVKELKKENVELRERIFRMEELGKRDLAHLKE